jgi:integrase/recombinase XerD
MIQAQIADVGWQDAIELYEADCELAATTKSSNIRTFRRFSAFIQTPPNRITRLHVVRFLQRYSDFGSYNTYLFSLRSFFVWFSETYNYPDPTAKLKQKKPDMIKTQRILSHEEYEAIKADNSSARDYAVFLCNTGLRIAEFCGIRPEYVNLATRELKVLGKGSKPRTIPLNQTAVEILQKYHLQFPKSDSTIKYAFATLSKRLGIKHFNPHACRHYFATELIRRKANIADVSKILGHSSIQTTIAFYYHSTELRNVVDLLSDS